MAHWIYAVVAAALLGWILGYLMGGYASELESFYLACENANGIATTPSGSNWECYERDSHELIFIFERQ